jgi:two-component system cell cycle sensor histidine kinase/response regulator CckA
MKAAFVDSDSTVRRALEDAARQIELECAAFPDAVRAWDAIRKERPQLVVIDWQLPAHGGPELCKRLRALPGGEQFVILAIAARSEPNDHVGALEAGADDYLPKPLLADVLVRRLSFARRHAAALTRRHETESAFNKIEERFHLLARATNDAIWDWDLTADRIEWNEGVQRLFGYVPDEITPGSDWWANNIHPEDRARVLAGKKASIEGPYTYWSSEYLYRCSNGFYLSVLDRGHIVRNAAGRGIRMVGSMMDITERKQALAKIERLASFPKFNPNPVLEFTSDGSLIYFNDATAQLARDLKRQHPVEVIPAETAEIVRECLATNRSVLRRETKIEGRVLSWSFYPIAAVRAVHCYAADITDKLNLESQVRQAQKLDSIGQLSAGVAHDFNNILTVIRGYSSLLLNQPGFDAKAIEGLSQINTAGERAANLTRQLLLFSRKQVIERRQLDLHELLGNLTKMLQRILGEDILLDHIEAPDLPPVFADAGMLDQVVMNLAVNARDAMPTGGKLTLTTSVEEFNAAMLPRAVGARPGRFVTLAVTDTGTGIAPEILEKIFEPFFTTKEVGKGTGLGLATVFGILKQHEGWIEVASQVGQGTTFKVALPVTDAPPRSERRRHTTHFVRSGHETVLLIEDDPALRGLARTVLQRYGYEVHEAGSAVEARGVWALYQERIALVLTDMVLPGGVSGPELARKLTAKKPALKVIFTSGYGVDLETQSLKLTPGVNFLQKPFNVDQLAKCVRDLLDTPMVDTSPGASA